MEILRPDIAAALLQELARALRAWGFYRAEPLQLAALLERAGAVWAQHLGAGRPLAVEVREGRFQSGCELVPGWGLEEVMELFAARDIHHLQAEPGFQAGELAELVRVLSDGPGSAEELERELRERGARHLWLTPLPCGSARELADRTVALLQALERLEAAQTPRDYRDVARAVEADVDRLLREGAVADAYRAPLVLCRHATDPERRGSALQREALERLHRLLSREPLLEYTLDQACGSPGLGSVRASQILLAASELSAWPLVERYVKGQGETLQTAAILVALGEKAIDLLIERLEATIGKGGAQARRAARILGDLQHPRAIPVLAQALHVGDGGLRDEAARALARIGTTAAVHALVESLGDQGSARAIVASLSGSRHPLAVRALCDLAAGGGSEEALALEAIRALGHPGNGGAVPTLRALLARRGLLARRATRRRRIAAALALGRIGGPIARDALQAHAGERDLGDACRRALELLHLPVAPMASGGRPR